MAAFIVNDLANPRITRKIDSLLLFLFTIFYAIAFSLSLFGPQVNVFHLVRQTRYTIIIASKALAFIFNARIIIAKYCKTTNYDDDSRVSTASFKSWMKISMSFLDVSLPTLILKAFKAISSGTPHATSTGEALERWEWQAGPALA